MVLDLIPPFSPSLLGLFTSPGETAFTIGSLHVRWYGILIASAVLIGIQLSRFLAKRRRVDPDLMSDLILWLIISAIPSARLYYVLFQWRDYAANPGEILQIWRGGIAIHGAILGGAVATFLFSRFKKVSFWQVADLVAPSLILGQAIGRWGNFFNSEAFGSPTDLPWKLFIPLSRRPVGYETIAYYHPTFLYESLWNLMTLGILLLLFFLGVQGKLRLKVGTIFLTYMVSYSLGRVWIEGLRTDSLMLSSSLRIAQIVSLVAIVLGVAGLLWLYALKRPLPDVVPPPSLNPDSQASPP